MSGRICIICFRRKTLDSLCKIREMRLHDHLTMVKEHMVKWIKINLVSKPINLLKLLGKICRYIKQEQIGLRDTDYVGKMS
jgi:hypothetical protein